MTYTGLGLHLLRVPQISIGRSLKDLGRRLRRILTISRTPLSFPTTWIYEFSYTSRCPSHLSPPFPCSSQTFVCVVYVSWNPTPKFLSSFLTLNSNTDDYYSDTGFLTLHVMTTLMPFTSCHVPVSLSLSFWIIGYKFLNTWLQVSELSFLVSLLIYFFTHSNWLGQNTCSYFSVLLGRWAGIFPENGC